jgi:hypothetical protein
LKKNRVLQGILFAGLLLLAPGLDGATNPPPAPKGAAPKTGVSPPARSGAPPTNAVAARSGPQTNRAAAVPAGARTNAATVKPPGATNAWSGILESIKRFPASPSFRPAVVIAIVVCLIVLLIVRTLKSKAKPAAPAPGVSSKLAVKRTRSQATIHACNVLEVSPQARQLWQFDVRGGRFVPGRHQTCLPDQPLPRGMVARDWRSLFYHKLNIAWVPPEHVFLRVAQLPKSDLNETLSMVELQLEKLSPMPVAQIAWSVQVLPHTDSQLQTVVVTIVSRETVEEFLGKLEGQGFLADRLEVPVLDQLQANTATEDGAWIYPGAIGGKHSALVAWWNGGVLQNLDLLTLPPTNQPAGLKEQLTQMAWAGEMEGWLTGPPEWHLVAGPAAADWEPALRAGLEQPLKLSAPLAERDLAALTARRSAQTEPRANLMPPEFSVRYQQQFVDRLWMRGLMAAFAIYCVVLAIYGARLGYASYLTSGVESEVASLGQAYTNSIQLRDKYKVLKDRQDLKYAALDCWNAVAERLPRDATIESISFSDGKKFLVNGTAPTGMFKALLDFEADMRKVTVNAQLLFDPRGGENIQISAPSAGSSVVSWHLTLELQRSEGQ